MAKEFISFDACPSREFLNSFLGQKLPLEEVKSYEIHLKSCEPCRKLLEESTADHKPLAEPQRPACQVVLTVIEGPLKGRKLEYSENDLLMVGRGSNAGLQLSNDPHFSRNHLLLEIKPPRVFLRDLDSRNGTLVNGSRVKQCLLKSGDIISGGASKILLTILDERAEPPTEETVIQPPSTRTAKTGRPAETIGDYELVCPLGRGGMGMVHLAVRRSTGESVALKLIVPESSTNERALNRFFREARVLSRLDHPRIVKFLDFGMDRGRVFLVMEYVETIDPQLELDGKSTLEKIRTYCSVMELVLDGLDYAHGLGFVHRDIKPANVLISRGVSDAFDAKLADFGLAKNFEQTGMSGLTHEGTALGTVPFMAPELVLQANSALPPADIYAAGATLYFMLTQRYPHDFPKKADPIRIILEEPAIPIQERLPKVPREVAELIHRCLEKSPKDRFASVYDLQSAITRAIQRMPK